MFLAVHHDLQRLLEAHMAHEVGLLDSGHRIEYLLLEDAVAGVGVDGEIAYAERGEVLEEVGALGGIDMVVLQT